MMFVFVYQYLITKKAWEAGGYEPLIARSSLPSWEGVSYMVEEGIKLLKQLYKKGEFYETRTKNLSD